VVGSSSLAAEKDRPNIVFILIDDFGWADVGCNGSSFYETPNVDRLAAAGMRFSNAYAASPVCSPTRASILTGKYPARINFTRATPTENLPHSEVTLAEALKEAGYRTAHVGKWHMQLYGEKGKGHSPEAHGFDVNIAGHAAGQPGSYFYPYASKRHPRNNVPGLGDGRPGEYLTDRLTDEAIAFMDSSKGSPFFLNLWYYTVHTPVTGKKDKIEKYRKKAEDAGLSTSDGSVREYESHSRKQQSDPVYAAMVESMDENVGRILDYLREAGLADNTIVIFVSDNGGLSTSRSERGGPTSCLPLRAGKAWVYEGGIREPLIIKWPSVTTKGSVCDTPVISTDFYPTILDMVGLAQRPEQHLDGVSLAGLLRGKTARLDREALYFHFPHDHHINSMGASRATRVGDYKLVERFSNMKVELFNLRHDIGEQNDLSQTEPELAAKLREMLHDWRAKSGAWMPAPNPDYGKANEQTGKQGSRSQKTGKASRAARKNPIVENKPVTISCHAAPGENPDGLLVAQGGRAYGYSVYVQNGKPCFSVRTDRKLTTVRSATPAPGSPFRIEAVLGQGGEMGLRVDGIEVATGNAGSLITTQPGVGFSIGQDTHTPVGPYQLPFAYGGKVSEVVVNGQEMTVPRAGQTRFYTPKQDRDGLKKATPQKAGLPKVLLLGDSISIGYAKATIALLKDVANVQRAKANCGDTKSGLKYLKRWLGTTNWDVIHFNWGLHDLCYRHPDSKVYGHRDKAKGTIAVPLDQYEKNLEELVQRLKETGASLIWASTTIVPEGEAGRHVGDEIKYNAVARRIMERHDVTINDLRALTATFPPKLFSAPGDVHFKKEGSLRLARQVAESVKEALRK